MKTEAVSQVGVVDALSSGLRLVVRRPWLMIVPILTELLLWLAPQVSIGTLLERAMKVWEGLLRATYSPAQFPNMNEMMTTMYSTSREIAASFNVAEAISGGWLGVPSVFSSAQVTRMTFISDLILAPAGISLQLGHMAPASFRGAPVEIGNLWTFLGATIGFWLVGQLLATVYLRWVGAAWRGKANAGYWAGPKGLLKLGLRLLIYSVLLGLVILVLRLPLAVALTLLFMSSNSALGMIMLLFSGVALWLTLWFLTSLFFVNEAILLDRQPIIRAIGQSVILVHNNFWPTMGMCLLINLLMYGFRVVWGIMGQSLIGAGLAIVGNAYLATALLLSVFVFYDNLARRTVAKRMVTGKR